MEERTDSGRWGLTIFNEGAIQTLSVIIVGQRNGLCHTESRKQISLSCL